MFPSPSRFIWFELMTVDMRAACSFYADVVGWTVRDASVPGLPYTLMMAGGRSICGMMPFSNTVKSAKAQPSWIGYVGTGDVEAAADRVAGLGGRVHIPPTEVPGVSRFAIVSDPQAARLGLFRWLMPRAEIVHPNGHPGHVGWSELLATDGPTALGFYRALFAWDSAEDEAVEPAGAYRVFSADADPIGGVVTKPATVPDPFWLHYFVVPDIARAAERVLERGGRILSGPMEGPGGTWILQGMDPQGVIFALMGRGQARTATLTWASDWPGRAFSGSVRITRVGAPAAAREKPSPQK